MTCLEILATDRLGTGEQSLIEFSVWSVRLGGVDLGVMAKVDATRTNRTQSE